MNHFLNGIDLRSETPANFKEIIFGAGCFWGVEENFRTKPGIISTEVGYAGGKDENVNYEKVCKGNTGHAETVKIEFDENIISYEKILDLYSLA